MFISLCIHELLPLLVVCRKKELLPIGSKWWISIFFCSSLTTNSLTATNLLFLDLSLFIKLDNFWLEKSPIPVDIISKLFCFWLSLIFESVPSSFESLFASSDRFFLTLAAKVLYWCNLISGEISLLEDAFVVAFFKLGLPLFFFVPVRGSILIIGSTQGSTTADDSGRSKFCWWNTWNTQLYNYLVFITKELQVSSSKLFAQMWFESLSELRVRTHCCLYFCKTIFLYSYVLVGIFQI